MIPAFEFLRRHSASDDGQAKDSEESDTKENGGPVWAAAC